MATRNNEPFPRLETIAAQLEALEETIIFKFSDRVQCKQNLKIYKPGESGFSASPPAIWDDGKTKRGTEEQSSDTSSLLDLRIQYQEQMDALFGRFSVPEERPFTRDLPKSRRKVQLPLNPLNLSDYNIVNLTGEIYSAYREFVPLLCEEGDDAQYGSSVEYDVAALQAISRRIHYGAMYVGEIKYRGNPEVYEKLIHDGDTNGIMLQLTRPDVEEKIFQRVGGKLDYIQKMVNLRVRKLLEKEGLITFFRNVIIPLTKKGEVLYLLNRMPPTV